MLFPYDFYQIISTRTYMFIEDSTKIIKFHFFALKTNTILECECIQVLAYIYTDCRYARLDES